VFDSDSRKGQRSRWDSAVLQKIADLGSGKETIKALNAIMVLITDNAEIPLLIIP